MLIQTASLVSYLGVTFLIGAVSAGIALSLRDRKAAAGRHRDRVVRA